MRLGIVGCLMIAAASLDATAKPSAAPIQVDYVVPEDVKQGDEVTTTFTFRALAEVDRVEVAVTRLDGLELLSLPSQVTFTAMKAGETRQWTVKVRLTAPATGYLSFNCDVRQGDQRTGKAVVVRYGKQPESPAAL